MDKIIPAQVLANAERSAKKYYPDSAQEQSSYVSGYIACYLEDLAYKQGESSASEELAVERLIESTLEST